jgi:hypothetical protein
MRLLPFFLVGVGGFLGANARFVVARLAGALFETRLPPPAAPPVYSGWPACAGPIR